MITSFILVILYAHQQKRRKLAHENEVLKKTFEENLLHAQLEIQEQTLRNISQEIHDNIGQTLSLAKLNLNTITLHQEDKISEKVLNSKELLTKAIADLRFLSKTMHSDAALHGGLLKALEVELIMIGKSADIETRLDVQGEAPMLDPQKELILFRMVQESLNNALKHADASELTININGGPAAHIISVIDNGKGMPVTKKEKDIAGGSGMLNIRNRASLIGGTLNILPNHPQGTIIQITLPKINT